MLAIGVCLIDIGYRRVLVANQTRIYLSALRSRRRSARRTKIGTKPPGGVPSRIHAFNPRQMRGKMAAIAVHRAPFIGASDLQGLRALTVAQ
jgi:hypothetical protein